VFNMSPSHRGSSYEAYWQRGTVPTSAQPSMEAPRPRAESEPYPAAVATVEPEDEPLPDGEAVDMPSAADEDVRPAPPDPRDGAEVHDEGVQPVSSASSSFRPWKARPDH
jgi:hypothetical protein